ncbi:Core-2/I-Branching enzyme [Dictyocaulus viviparus]|uniref:Core-2/I-Branching enzyme n=1 Tax=Dictyocaulus viviparus TaxID=29172 RepID=A0A0D8XHW8_DICVI|nr:Core-2/I-Branching enzyme [Dictyocaulus viviparus]
MDCGKYQRENGKELLAEYIQDRTVRTKSVALNGTKCRAIRKRRYMPSEVPDSMEVHYNMFFLRIVSKDYDFVEEVTTMMYSPLHFYCFVIDNKASAEFENLVRRLSECILNIIVPPLTFDTSTIHGTFLALNACYNGMEKFPWKHSIITTENEIPIHSIHYIAENARRLNEAARIGRITISEEHVRILGDDLNKSNPRDQEFLRRAICTWYNSRRFPLTLPRSFQQVLFKFINAQNLENCQLLSPEFDKDVALDVCRTNHYDKWGNCVIGMEDYVSITKSKNLFVRADPTFDFGIIECVEQFVYQRTYDINHGDFNSQNNKSVKHLIDRPSLLSL